VLFGENAAFSRLGQRSTQYFAPARPCRGLDGRGCGRGHRRAQWKRRGEHIDVDLQVPVRIDAVNGQRATATVGRTQEIEGDGPDSGAAQGFRNSGLVPMKRGPVTARAGRLGGLQSGMLAGMQFQLQVKAIEIVAAEGG